MQESKGLNEILSEKQMLLPKAMKFTGNRSRKLEVIRSYHEKNIEDTKYQELKDKLIN